jgi:hypothetical protein
VGFGLLPPWPAFGHEFDPVTWSDQSSLLVAFVAVGHRLGLVAQGLLVPATGAIAAHNWSNAQICPGGPEWHYRLCRSSNSWDS